MRKMFVVGCLMLFLLVGVIGVLAVENEWNRNASETVVLMQDPTNDFVGLPLEDALEYLDNREKEKIQQAKEAGTYVEPEAGPKPWYEVCYDNATEEQKKELDSYRGPFGWNYMSYPRQTRIIVGEIPADAPRLTLAQAEAIISGERSNQKNSYYLASFNSIYAAFTQIAVEDHYGGSGITHVYFGLNDSLTQYLDLSDDRIRYFDTEANICVTMCKFYDACDCVSVLELMEKGEIPPLRED